MSRSFSSRCVGQRGGRCHILTAAMVLGAIVAAFNVPSASAAEKSGRLFYLGVTYGGDAPDKNPNEFNFATEGLSALLRAQSEPAFHEIHVHELKGEAATRDAWKNKLDELRGQAQGEDLVIVYYGSPATAARKDGWHAELSGEALHGGELRAALAAFPCPVMAVISNPGSGGFAHPGKRETALSPNVTALCACKRKSPTSNQLDVALAEALAGFADRDANGDVTLGEVLDYLPQRYREHLTEEQQKSDSLDLMPVLVRSDSAPLDRVLTKASPDRVAAWHRDDFRGGLRRGDEDGKPRIEFLGWDRHNADSPYYMPDAVLEPEMVLAPSAFPPTRVEQGGVWYPARILGRDGRGIRVHYLGYPSTEDETVQPNRIRYRLHARGSGKGRGDGKRKREVQLTAVEQRFVNAINAARLKQGLAALKINAALVGECREHAGAMASRGVVQDSFDGENPGDRIHGAGVTPIHWGITSGKGKTVDAVVKEWVESTIAAANILEPHVTELGIGVANDPAGGHYAAATYVEIGP